MTFKIKPILKILHQIKFYFTYHRKDKYGIIVLLVICGVLLTAPELYYQLVAKQKIIDHINITHEKFASLIKQVETANPSIYFDDEKTNSTPVKNETTPVDVNLATEEELKQLNGIGEVFSKRIIKYRDSKNGFETIADLKNVYGITDSLYNALLPNLAFTTVKKPSRKNKLAKNNDENNFETQKPSYTSKKKKQKTVSAIDINTATVSDFKLLKGIGKVLSERIVKFRDAIGGFKNIAQLNEVYGIEDSLYFTLLDNIEMSKVEKPAEVLESKPKEASTLVMATEETSYKKIDSEPKVNKPAGPGKPKLAVIVDINKATAAEFQLLNGIGNFRAKEIVAQREKLGGFYKIEQLKEVYSFTDSLYNALKPQLNISTTKIKKININTVEFKTLLKHPYFDYNLTKHLVNFRENRKGLKSLEDLKESYLVDDKLYEKLTVYLTVD